MLKSSCKRIFCLYNVYNMTTEEPCYRLKSTSTRIFCMTVYYDYRGALLHGLKHQYRLFFFVVYMSTSVEPFQVDEHY